MTSTPAPGVEELDDARSVLVFARSRRVEADAAEADILAAAATWAEQHPAESIATAATVRAGGGHETGIPLAGPGAPLVAEFCIPELALALGMSHDAGRALIGDALELRHRLPRLWAAVQTGRVVAWRARRIAERTHSLSVEAATWVDAQITPFAHTLGPAAIERLVTEALASFMPAQAEADALAAWEDRHFTIHHEHLTAHGTSRVEGVLDLADALDLDDAIAREAATLAAAGCEAPLDVRRSMAAGLIARHQLALELQQGFAGSAGPSAKPGRALQPRQVVLHVHLSSHALTHPQCPDLATVEEQHQLVTTAQVRTWCTDPATTVTVRPVIDLNAHLGSEQYAVPPVLREQVVLRDRTCVFPRCTRTARDCDLDHVVPFEAGGTTTSDNLAPLCRRHHRLKTHGGWHCVMTTLGSFTWTSPHGYHYRRDPGGTTALPPPDPG